MKITDTNDIRCRNNEICTNPLPPSGREGDRRRSVEGARDRTFVYVFVQDSGGE